MWIYSRTFRDTRPGHVLRRRMGARGLLRCMLVPPRSLNVTWQVTANINSQSIAYEIAPFNIKLTILQGSMEIGLLTNPISVAPLLSAYSPETNPAPLFRGILDDILQHLPGTKRSGLHDGISATEEELSASNVDAASQPVTAPSASLKESPAQSQESLRGEDSDADSPSQSTARRPPSSTTSEHPRPNNQKGNTSLQQQSSTSRSASRSSPTPQPSKLKFLSSTSQVRTFYAPLSTEHINLLIAETVHAITAIGGHENPPARHIVGVEGVASVKEKLKTVSEELEEFLECSCAVDFDAVNSITGSTGARTGSIAGTTGGGNEEGEEGGEMDEGP